MGRIRAAIIAFAVAAVAISGVFTVGRVLAPGSQKPAVTNAEVARRARQLDRYEASLVRALAKRPPALPPIPVASSAGAQQAVAAPVVYRRLPSVVVAGARPTDDAGEQSDD